MTFQVFGYQLQHLVLLSLKLEQWVKQGSVHRVNQTFTLVIHRPFCVWNLLAQNNHNKCLVYSVDIVYMQYLKWDVFKLISWYGAWKSVSTKFVFFSTSECNFRGQCAATKNLTYGPSIQCNILEYDLDISKYNAFTTHVHMKVIHGYVWFRQITWRCSLGLVVRQSHHWLVTKNILTLLHTGKQKEQDDNTEWKINELF